MAKIKILTSQYESKLEKLINDSLSEGYELHGELSTYDRWEDETEGMSSKKTGRRIQVTYFKQVMIKTDESPSHPPYTPDGDSVLPGLSK